MRIHKFVINLDRRPDRLRDFHARCPWDDVVRIPAVDGSELKTVLAGDREFMRLLRHAVYLGYRKPVLTGNVGCSFSHYETWKHIAGARDYSDDDLFLIMEDDAIFSPRLAHEWERFLGQLGLQTFELVYLGGRFTPDFAPLIPSDWTKLGGGLYRRENKSYVTKSGGADWDRTAHAYLVTRDCCRFLIESNLTLLTLPVDHWIANLLSRKGKVTLDYFPHLVHVPRDYDSDVQGKSKIDLAEFINSTGIGKLEFFLYKVARKLAARAGRETELRLPNPGNS